MRRWPARMKIASLASSSRMRATKMPTYPSGVCSPRRTASGSPTTKAPTDVAHDDAAHVVAAGQDAGADDHVAHLDHLEGGVDEDADARHRPHVATGLAEEHVEEEDRGGEEHPEDRGRPDARHA